MPGGRPTKLTKKLHEEVVSYLRNGNYLETAAALAGLDVSTIRRWLKRGERAASGPYAEFCTAVKSAESAAEAKSLMRIRMAGTSGVWQADAWYLERKFPSKWGRWERLSHGEIPATDQAKEALKDKEVRDLLDAAARRMGMAGNTGRDG